MEGKCECTMDTKVKEGTLEVTKTGSIPNSKTEVGRDEKTKAKAVIKGKGTVKQVQLKKGAKIKPGGSPGTFTVTGDMIWEGDTDPDPDPSSYQWDINDAMGAEGPTRAGDSLTCKAL